MALTVSGLNVIDDLRNLANIANLKTIDSNDILGSGNITSSDVDLLGTITTTSGTSQQLSGLTLTNYSHLLLSVNGISHNDTSFPRSILLGQSSLNDKQFTPTFSNTGTARGIVHISLNTGILTSYVDVGSVTTVIRGDWIFSRSSTTIFVATDAAGVNFDAGTIRVYGILGDL